MHFYEKKVDFSRRHMLIELRKAQAIYDRTFTRDDICDAAELYKKKICYHNGYLYVFCRITRPDVVVETGVHYGSSSAFILQALHDNHSGRLYSIDLPDAKYVRDDGMPQHDAINPANIGYSVPTELRDRWTLIRGDAKEKLPELLASLGSVDIFHHDSAHTYDHMHFEYETAWPKIRTGGALMSDDITWSNAFLDFCHEKNVQPHRVRWMGFALKE
jgi:predicted O-methyltransferase YrrM